MNFLINIIGPPLPTAKPIRCGSYHLLVTTLGFVVGEPNAFGTPELAGEAATLPSGTGFIRDRLHLRSRRFPMDFPGASPRLLLVTSRLTVMPLHAVSSAIREAIDQAIPRSPLPESPDPKTLMNVLPWFEFYEDSTAMAPV